MSGPSPSNGNGDASQYRARTCVRDLIGDHEPTSNDILRVMQHFLEYDFVPLIRSSHRQSAELKGIKETILEWRASMRTLMLVCAALGGLIAAVGTIVGILIAAQALAA